MYGKCVEYIMALPEEHIPRACNPEESLNRSSRKKMWKRRAKKRLENVGEIQNRMATETDRTDRTAR